MIIANKFNVTVYADISCPFCFVLHERLETLERLDGIEWRTIEHAPSANAVKQDPRQMAQLNEEFRQVVKRAEDVKVCNPGFVPNTALVNRYLAWVDEHHSDMLINVRRAVYRALWQQGLDISKPEVLDQLFAGFDLLVDEIDDSINDKLALWQRKWHFSDFDLRIPVMLRNKTEVLLGLQHKQTIQSFIEAKLDGPYEIGDICRFMAKDTVVMFGSNNKPRFDDLYNSDQFGLNYYSDWHSLLADVEAQPLDILLLDAKLPESMTICKQVRSLGDRFGYLPIVFYNDEADPGLEYQVFALGANDYICLPEQRTVLLSRLKSLIRTKHQLDILSDHASHDGLTGLYNKREFEAFLEREWRQACRDKNNLGLLLMDIDDFKSYNDHYGHLAGDDVLLKVSDCLSKNVYRANDLAARYSGAEFVVIIPNTDYNSLMTIALRLRRGVANLKITNVKNKVSEFLTVSIGIAMAPAHADNNYLMLIEMVDNCLSKAKKNGRDTIEFEELKAPVY